MVTGFEYEGLYYKDKYFSVCVGINPNIKEAKLHKETRVIANKAFLNSNLKKIVCNEKLQRIGCFAFSASKIEDIVLPSSINKIEEHAFDNCHKLKKINLENVNVSILEEGAFFRCKKLENIIFPKNLKKIRKDCFAECEKLGNIDIPNTVERIEAGVFKHTALTQFVVPPHVKVIYEETFSECNLNEIDLSNIKEICHLAFLNNHNLRNIKLPDSLKSLNISAFNGTGIYEIALPSNIERISIGKNSNIQEIRYETLPENIESEIKKDCDRYGISFLKIDLDYLIEQGKSFHEINKFFKEQER